MGLLYLTVLCSQREEVAFFREHGFWQQSHGPVVKATPRGATSASKFSSTRIWPEVKMIPICSSNFSHMWLLRRAWMCCEVIIPLASPVWSFCKLTPLGDCGSPPLRLYPHATISVPGFLGWCECSSQGQQIQVPQPSGTAFTSVNSRVTLFSSATTKNICDSGISHQNLFVLFKRSCLESFWYLSVTCSSLLII